MPTIARYNAQLTATATQFISEFAKAQEAEKKLEDQSKTSGRSITATLAGIGAAIGAAAAVAGFISVAKAQMETVAATGRLSDSLGISTESLSRMHYAAQLSGVSV